MSEEGASSTGNGAINQLEQFFDFLVQYEIPSLYFLVETVFIGIGLSYLVWCAYAVRNLRSLTGNSGQMQFQNSETSPVQLVARFCAAAFLMSFGVGEAVIANSIFVSQSFEPYSIEMFRSISCASGVQSGCFHYDVGLYTNGDWTQQVVNESFFEMVTALMQITGVIGYGHGWIRVGRLGSTSSTTRPPTFWQCVTQLVTSVCFMHPYDFMELIT